MFFQNICKDNPIFVREFIDSKNSLIDGYRNCIRLMVVNNEIIGIYVRINNNNHDIRSCNINCNNFELNNVDKKLHKIKLEGLASRVFQHEHDHMEGIDFTQRDQHK